MPTKLIPNLKKDRLLNQCESYMLRGLDSPTDIACELKISFNTAKSYIATIHQRWVDSATYEDLQIKRQELIRKAEEVIKESWQLKNKAKNTLEATSCLRTIVMALERLEKLQGIDSIPLPKPITGEDRVQMMVEYSRTLPQDTQDQILTVVRQRIAELKDSQSPNLTPNGL